MADSQIGFVASGNLLVLNQDLLGVWDVETGKKVRDLPGKIARFALPPARNWVVICPRGGIGQDAAPMSILDPESGRVLGSLAGSGNWNRHVFSADGSRLTAVRQVDQFAPPHGAVNMEIASWDLRTGEPWTQPMSIQGRYPATFEAGGDRLFYHDHALRLLDLRRGTVEGELAFKAADGKGAPGYPVQPLDHRPWFSTGYFLFTVPLPESKGGGGMIGPGTTVQIESDFGNVDWDRRVKTLLETRVKERGGAIGPGGWTVRVRHHVEEVGALEMKAGNAVSVPHLIAQIDFRAPEGGAEMRRAEGAFLFQSSAYYIKTVKPTDRESVRKKLLSITYFDFKGKDPRTAMLEEAFEWLTRDIGRLPFPSVGKARAPGKDTPEPITILVPAEVVPPRHN
jgi:hypothetical protein